MAKKTPIDTERLLPAADQVRVRLYSQGLGDCFLLAFPRPSNADLDDPCYLLIDCGAAVSTPGRSDRAKQIVANIHKATNGHIDILVITHQHYDHISGFQDAWQLWETFQIDNLYLPWSDATAESDEAKSTSKFREVLERAAQRVLESGLADDTRPDLGAGKGPDDMNETMAFIRSLSKNPPTYFVPGDVFRLPGTDSHGYVLGPPRPHQTNEKGKRYIELLADETPGVMFSYRDKDLNMPVDPGTHTGHSFALSDDKGLPAAASAILAADTLPDSDLRDSDDCFSPFAPELRLEWDGALAEGSFFQGIYEKDPWRKIDTDWLMGAASMGLRAGGFTNNTSMVLAFDQPGTDKMLLFPGDAQVGNWLSWHDITRWSYRDTPAPKAQPPMADPTTAANPRTLMENLLARVAFYKAGHHGSHNATIKDKGLSKMVHEGLVAYVPVSIPVAQDYMSYCPMPFYPVIRALQTATQGRVFLPNGRPIEPLPEGLEAGKEQETLRKQANITLADIKIPAIEDVEEMPLYLEYTQSTTQVK